MKHVHDLPARPSCKRSYRNPRYMLFTLGIPVVLFLVIGNAFDGDASAESAARPGT